MAEDDYSIKFGEQQLLVEDPPGSGIFAAPCGITGLTRAVETNTNDVQLPPCDDPNAVIWLGVDIISKRMTLTFSGTLSKTSLPVWDEWSFSEGTRKVRWYRNLGAPNQGYWEGPGVLTNYQEESSDRGRYTNTGTIMFDGRPTWVSIPPAPAVTTPITIPATVPTSGEIFTAVTGTYTGTPTKSYQWFSKASKNGPATAIVGATAITYTPGAPDVGRILYVVETVTNVSGTNQSQSADSLPVEA